MTTTPLPTAGLGVEAPPGRDGALARGGEQTRAAQLLGIHRTNFQRLVQMLGVGRPACLREAPGGFSAWLLDMALRDVAEHGAPVRTLHAAVARRRRKR